MVNEAVAYPDDFLLSPLLAGREDSNNQRGIFIQLGSDWLLLMWCNKRGFPGPFKFLVIEVYKNILSLKKKQCQQLPITMFLTPPKAPEGEPSEKL